MIDLSDWKRTKAWKATRVIPLGPHSSMRGFPALPVGWPLLRLWGWIVRKVNENHYELKVELFCVRCASVAWDREIRDKKSEIQLVLRYMKCDNCGLETDRGYSRESHVLSVVVTPPPMAGIVYFITADINGHKYCKIGQGTSMARLSVFPVKVPFETKVFRVLKTDDRMATEAYFHRMFKARRREGEWFELTTKDYDLIEAEIVSLKAGGAL